MEIWVEKIVSAPCAPRAIHYHPLLALAAAQALSPTGCLHLPRQHGNNQLKPLPTSESSTSLADFKG